MAFPRLLLFNVANLAFVSLAFYIRTKRTKTVLAQCFAYSWREPAQITSHRCPLYGGCSTESQSAGSVWSFKAV